MSSVRKGSISGWMGGKEVGEQKRDGRVGCPVVADAEREREGIHPFFECQKFRGLGCQ